LENDTVDAKNDDNHKENITTRAKWEQNNIQINNDNEEKEKEMDNQIAIIIIIQDPEAIVHLK